MLRKFKDITDLKCLVSMCKKMQSSVEYKLKLRDKRKGYMRVEMDWSGESF